MNVNDLSPEQRAELEEKIKNMSPEELAKLQSQECIFCSIVAGKVPSKKVYEDDVCIAFLDINPAVKGHILLLPRSHISIMPQLDEKTGGHLLQVARELSRSLLKNLYASGSTIFVANGLAAGQRAQHFLIHIIPRKEGDELFGYEKHIVDEEKRLALRDLIAARMVQLTDFEDVYASEEFSEEVPDSEKETEHESVEAEAANDAKEDDLDEIEEDNTSEEDSENDDIKEESDDTEEETEPGQATNASLDDIANLFK